MTPTDKAARQELMNRINEAQHELSQMKVFLWSGGTKPKLNKKALLWHRKEIIKCLKLDNFKFLINHLEDEQ